jgi:hypothetical protein
MNSILLTALKKKIDWRDLPGFLLAAMATGLLLQVALNRRFDHDEFEHIHSAWYIARGAVPYRDFFQHHNPLFWYLTAPLTILMGESTGILIFLRIAMFLMAVCTALVAAVTAVRISSKPIAGLYCYILLLSCNMFAEKVVEIRPDVPMVMMGMLSVYFFMQFLDTSSIKDIIFSGVCAAISFLFLQKAIFLCATLSLFMLIMAVRRKASLKAGLSFFICLGTSFILPFLFFACQGALHDYFLNGYLLNLSNSYSFALWESLQPYLFVDTGFWILGLAGICSGLYSFKRERKFGCIALLCILFFLSILTVPTPWKQYFMQALVMFSIAGACVLAHLTIKMKIQAIKALGFLILAIIVYRPMRELLEYRTSSPKAQIEMIKYATSITNSNDFVYDGDIQFNLFRKDLHYFWFSTSNKHKLNLYNGLTGNMYGNYNACSLITEKNPSLVSDYGIDVARCPAFGRYRQDERFTLLKVYRRVDDP